jgi:hypothetical protein
MATAAPNTYAGAFVLGKTFQPSLTFVSGVSALLTNVRKGWKVSPRKNIMEHLQLQNVTKAVMGNKLY